jgi:hypothetical protein
MNEIVKIKERIQAEINKIYGMTGGALVILSAKTPCGRCYELAYITREVHWGLPELQPTPVCLACAAEAERLGVEVRDIV